MSLRESKQNYDALKLSFFELKNKNEILNMKYEEINEENFNYKKEMIKLEREVKVQREIIEKLRNEVLEDKQNIIGGYNNSNINNHNNSYEAHLKEYNTSNSNNYYNRETVPVHTNEEYEDRNINNYNNRNNQNNQNNQNNRYDNNIEKPIVEKTISNRKISTSNKSLEDYTELKIAKQINKKINMKNDIMYMSNDMSMLPSQKVGQEREFKVREVEVKLCEAQKEKDRIDSELGKIPEFPKTKIQINKKRELELNYKEIIKEVSKQKHALRELNAVNRDY